MSQFFTVVYLLENYSKYFADLLALILICWLSGERSLPFGLFVERSDDLSSFTRHDTNRR